MVTKRREGFAIVMAIMVIGFLSVSLMAAFGQVEAEHKVITNRNAMVDAFSLAQTGLERFAANRAALGFTSSPPAATENATITLTGGTAEVTLEQVVSGANPLYVIRSTGITTPPPLTGHLPARHTVAMYYRWKPATMDVYAGWTSLTGNQKHGNSGELSGIDNCGSQPAVAGVATPTGQWSPTGGFTPEGTPGHQPMGTQAEMAAMIDIDWAGIVGGTALTPTLTIPGDSWPGSFPSGWWPVIFVNQASFALPGSGRGMLIVTGDLTISGSKQWDGILLVGGAMISNGDNTLHGAAVTGLNVKLGMSPGASDAGNGIKDYQYDSCNVAAALSAFGSLIPMTNTWVDNWEW